MGTRDEATGALAAVEHGCRALLRRAGQLDLQSRRALATRLREFVARIGHANRAALLASRESEAQRDAIERGAARVAEMVDGVVELAGELLGDVPAESIAAGTAAIMLACQHAAEVAASGFAAPALEPPIEACGRERTFFLRQVRYYNAVS